VLTIAANRAALTLALLGNNDMNTFEQKLFNTLQEKKLISEKGAQDLFRDLSNIEGSLESMLVQKVKISQDDILSAKSSLAGLPSFKLEDEKTIPQDVLASISEEAAQQYKIAPLEKRGNKLKIGIVNPEDYAAREAVRFIALGGNFEPELYVITDEAFKKVLRRYRTLRGVIEQALTELKEELKKPKGIKVPDEPGMIREAPITKMVAVILKHAVEGKASDIHIEGGIERTRVRFRVHGKLYTSIFLPSKIHASIVSRVKILSNLRLDESRIPQDGRFSAEISGRNIDFRVSTFPTKDAEKVVLRVLDPTSAIQSFSDLGLVGLNLKRVEEAIEMPFGMILISGPTGSGKSTTLYAALMSLDKESLNVVSLEDPIEYFIEGVNQSQIHQEIGYTFASGLRHVLRQDPDIIMVGEIRDAETADLATHASLTGHLVFSTIHTNNAMGVIPRLVDMGVKPFLIPSSVVLAVAQRLVRRLCPYCKVSTVVAPRIAKIIKREIELMSGEVKSHFKIGARDSYKLWNSPGCNKCFRRGTIGRIAIFEVLSMTEELKGIIYSEPTEIKIEEEAKRQGMVTLFQDGIIKALQGVISIEEVLRVSGE